MRYRVKRVVQGKDYEVSVHEDKIYNVGDKYYVGNVLFIVLKVYG